MKHSRPDSPSTWRPLAHVALRDETMRSDVVDALHRHGWAVVEWECALKHPEDGAREGAEFIRQHIVRVTERAFDDFAAGADWDVRLGEGNAWLLEGSLVFLSDLVRAIPAPVRFELIQVHSGEDSGVIRIEYPIPVDIAGQSVVVVKDVVASGVTEPYLGQQLRDHGARQVRFATLIDLPDERKTDFQPDYAAFSTSRRGVLVGYGLKHMGRYGNLPGVGRVRGTE